MARAERPKPLDADGEVPFSAANGPASEDLQHPTGEETRKLRYYGQRLAAESDMDSGPDASSNTALPYRSIFDAPMGNDFLSALQPEDLPLDSLIQALAFIRSIVHRYKQNGSFGTIVQFSPDREPTRPTIIFGFPQPPGDIGTELLLHESDTRLPIKVSCGGLDEAATAPTSWLNQRIKDHAQLDINDASIGEQRSFPRLEALEAISRPPVVQFWGYRIIPVITKFHRPRSN
ncbi:hypothetical protein FN846DRAFT_191330 [Sphaerosporella brunnea]|uniref:Uncharacterized protein n=1 Tax=Sphaerosporella brunnea TaxID=1250544 RepID=A0A5J5EPJ3_9PEZI|nr:hypothetical protein FN846DRAFT_191330 [Sphaerosporella brunnea]